MIRYVSRIQAFLWKHVQAHPLQRCYLHEETATPCPDGGKLVACEPVVLELIDASTGARMQLENDIFAMTTPMGESVSRSFGGATRIHHFLAI